VTTRGGAVHPKGDPEVHPFGPGTRVYGGGGAGVAEAVGCGDAVHRAEESVGEQLKGLEDRPWVVGEVHASVSACPDGKMSASPFL